MLEFNVDSITKHLCKRCGLDFTQKITLITHLKKKKTCMPIENNIEPHKLIEELKDITKKTGKECDKCNKIYKNDETLRKHKCVLEGTKEIANVINSENTVKDIIIKPLSINNYELVYRIKDGYVDVTNLCKAGGKEFKAWHRLDKTQAFLNVLSGLVNKSTNLLIQSIKDGKNEDRKTWVHPQIAINIAQWISPEFDVTVSKWIFELMVMGKVELNKEKTIEEVEIQYKKEINNLKLQYEALLYKHTSTLKKHHYVKFNNSDPCFYIIDSGANCNCSNSKIQYKFGIAGTEDNSTVDERLKSHRTLWPVLKVRYLLFMKDVVMIEKSFKMMYEKEINPNGHEIIQGVSLNDIVERIEQLLKVLCIKEYVVMSQEKLEEYNEYANMTIK